MKKIRIGRLIMLSVAIFLGPIVLEGCASGPKGGKKHCKGKNTARTKKIRAFAPAMSR